jgi:signal transduction histidine kinase
MAVLSPVTVPEGRLLDERTLALAELAGGIAHDFNNLLLAVRGYAELALGAAAEAGQRAHIERVIDAADKAASLTQQLLAFSRSRSADPAVLDLNAVVTEIGTLLECVVADDVELVTVLDAELGAVEVDRSQLEQVLMNLIVNARDAMPNGGRGRDAKRRARYRLGRGARRRARSGRLRLRLGRRQRQRHGRGHGGPHVRAVLHDEGRAGRNRTGTRDGLGDRQAKRRWDRRREPG